MLSHKMSRGDAKDAIIVQGAESEQIPMLLSYISILIHFYLDFFPVSLTFQHFNQMI